MLKKQQGIKMYLFVLANTLVEWTSCQDQVSNLTGNLLSWDTVVKASANQTAASIHSSQIDRQSVCSSTQSQLVLLPFNRDFMQVRFAKNTLQIRVFSSELYNINQN
jgi:hypothetical protein